MAQWPETGGLGFQICEDDSSVHIMVFDKRILFFGSESLTADKATGLTPGKLEAHIFHILETLTAQTGTEFGVGAEFLR